MVTNGFPFRRRTMGLGFLLASLVTMQAGIRQTLGVHQAADSGPMALGLESAWRDWATDFENLLADTLWLRIIQHVGGQLGSGLPVQVQGVQEAIDLAMDLDPDFHAPALHGVWMLADGGDPVGAIAVCEHGRRLHPHDWHYPYLQAFIEFLYRKRHLEAARLFESAANLPGSPPGTRRLAAGVYQRGHHPELAIRTWWAIHESNTGTTRAIAARNLRALGVAVQD